MRWPRKNDETSVEQRREAMGLDGSLVTSIDLEPFTGAAESLVGVAVIPVSACPVELELGSYELSDDSRPWLDPDSPTFSFPQLKQGQLDNLNAKAHWVDETKKDRMTMPIDDAVKYLAMHDGKMP